MLLIKTDKLGRSIKMAIKFDQLYEEVLNEAEGSRFSFGSDYLRRTAHKVGAAYGVAGAIGVGIAEKDFSTVAITAAAAYLLGFGAVWLADKFLSRELTRKEAYIKFRESVDRMKENPLFAERAKKKARDPGFRARMAALAKKYKGKY